MGTLRLVPMSKYNPVHFHFRFSLLRAYRINLYCFVGVADAPCNSGNVVLYEFRAAVPPTSGNRATSSSTTPVVAEAQGRDCVIM
jgi:hypothetical protein